MPAFSSSAFSTNAFSILAFDFGSIPPVLITSSPTGADADSWQRYLLWLQKKKKAEFKKKSTAAGIKEAVAVKISEIAAKEILKWESKLSKPFYEHISESDQKARKAVQESITDIYDEVWRQIAVQKKKISDLKINIKNKQERDEEDDIFLMIM